MTENESEGRGMGGWSIELLSSSCGPWRENAHWGKDLRTKPSVMLSLLVNKWFHQWKNGANTSPPPPVPASTNLNNDTTTEARVTLGPGAPSSDVTADRWVMGTGDQLSVSLPQTSPDRSRVLGVMSSRRCLIKMITSVKWDDNTDFQVVSTPVQDHPTARLSIYPTWTVPGPAIIRY